MSPTVVNLLISLISGLCVAVPSIITTVLTANSREKVQEERTIYKIEHYPEIMPEPETT